MGEALQHDVVYVAVSEDVQENKTTLLWTLKRLRGRKICLLHIHRLLNASGQGESEMNEIQESELKTSYDSLHKYKDICTNKGVNEKDVHVSMISRYCVGEGIVELIYQNNITKLVMGSRGMSITSRKAEYVSQLAPRGCKMWFICKGKRIKRKVGSSNLWNPSDSLLEVCDSSQIHETESSNEHSAKEFEIMYYQDQRRKIDIEEALERVKTEPCSSPCSVSDEPHADFFCPISKEIMREPHVAADGFTYENKEIRTWLSGGGQTSPKTGAKLDHHNLTPNFTLRSIINDWLQHHPHYIVD